MFGLFKKKKSESKEEPQEKELTSSEIEEINSRIKLLEDSVEGLSGDSKIDSLNELGKLYQKLKKKDEAIKYFEESLDEKEQFGDAYNGLLNLYEVKRKEAAFNKDDDAIQKWVSKTDNLMAISKKVLKSNY